MLVVEGLVKRFGGFTAVSNVSFKVDQGEILGLIGPNGSGKSTIFNMLSGTFPPSAGSIVFEGHEIGGLPPHRIINRGIGRPFQILNCMLAWRRNISTPSIAVAPTARASRRNFVFLGV